MTRILLQTNIKAPIEICFDLARSIDFHAHTMDQTREVAVSGCTAGMIEQDQEVTWKATHFFIRQRLSSKITAMKRPTSFTDEMITGAFKSMIHHHHFRQVNDYVCMEDDFTYTVPGGFAGRVFDFLFLRRYMTRLLKKRNAHLQETAETNGWKAFVSQSL